MDRLQFFQSSEFGELGILEIDGKPYFPASASAKILGYANPRDAIRRHCKTYGVIKHDGVSLTTNQHGVTTEQTTSMNYIDEGNLYRLIINSKLPAAKRFESWIFDEVLPSIRKYGMYPPPAVLVDRLINDPAALDTFLNAYHRERAAKGIPQLPSGID